MEPIPDNSSLIPEDPANESKDPDIIFREELRDEFWEDIQENEKEHGVNPEEHEEPLTMATVHD